jgi:hypothetical protein
MPRKTSGTVRPKTNLRKMQTLSLIAFLVLPQVQRLPSLPKTFAILWHEERYRIFTKGLSARMFQSGVFSIFIILGYESIKRLSVNEDFKDVVRW